MANLTQELRTSATNVASVAKTDMKLEVVVIPVSDVDRAKNFYTKLGWRVDADRSAGSEFRLVQFTPPGSKHFNSIWHVLHSWIFGTTRAS